VESKDVGDTSVHKFSVGVNYKKGEEYQASFFECEAWGKQGETIAKWFKKGSPIFIEGEIREERWEKDGEKRSKSKIRVTGFQFLPKSSEEPEEEEEKEEENPKTVKKKKPVPAETDDSEDVPF
jgi:single-strand DNA-binding protein